MQPLPRPTPQKLKPLVAPFDCDIDDETLHSLWARMRPLVVSKEDGELYWSTLPTDLRRVAYTWEVEPSGKKAEGLDPIATIRTLHKWAYYGMFKPSVAEVLAAIAKLPQETQEEIVAFHLISGPNDANDLNHEVEAVNAGYHVAYTVIYRKE